MCIKGSFWKEEYPFRGEVVGKQIPMNHINKDLVSHLPPRPSGTPPSLKEGN